MRRIECISITGLLFFIIAIGLVASCSDEAGAETAYQGHSELTIKLTDANADYDSVVVEIKSLNIKNGKPGHKEIFTSEDWQYKGKINLLDYQNGKDTTILKAKVKPGNFESVSLTLGEDNYVVTREGEKLPLKLSEECKKGLVVPIDAELIPETSYNFIVDFDAGKSIKEDENGELTMQPCLRAWGEARLGALQGYFNPKDNVELAYIVLANSDTLSSYPTPSGYFRISGVPTGNYKLYTKLHSFENASENLIDTLLIDKSLSVRSGAIRDLGKIRLNMN